MMVTLIEADDSITQYGGGVHHASGGVQTESAPNARQEALGAELRQLLRHEATVSAAASPRPCTSSPRSGWTGGYGSFGAYLWEEFGRQPVHDVDAYG